MSTLEAGRAGQRVGGVNFMISKVKSRKIKSSPGVEGVVGELPQDKNPGWWKSEEALMDTSIPAQVLN